MNTNRALLLVAGIVPASQLAFAATTLKPDDFAGATLYYKVITPKDYDPAKEYPAVLAFPAGEQSMPMVDGMIARNLKAAGGQARLHRGGLPGDGRRDCSTRAGPWCSPPCSTSFWAGYKIRGRKFHISGISNGGKSSFHIAALYPEVFLVGNRASGVSGESHERAHDALQGHVREHVCGRAGSGTGSTRCRSRLQDVPRQGGEGAVHDRKRPGPRDDFARRRGGGTVVRQLR